MQHNSAAVSLLCICYCTKDVCERQRETCLVPNCVSVLIAMCKGVDVDKCGCASDIREVGAPTHLVHAGRVHSHNGRVSQLVEHSLEFLPVVHGLVLEDLQQTTLVHHLPHQITHHCRRNSTGTDYTEAGSARV